MWMGHGEWKPHKTGRVTVTHTGKAVCSHVQLPSFQYHIKHSLVEGWSGREVDEVFIVELLPFLQAVEAVGGSSASRDLQLYPEGVQCGFIPCIWSWGTKHKSTAVYYSCRTKGVQCGFIPCIWSWGTKHKSTAVYYSCRTELSCEGLTISDDSWVLNKVCTVVFTTHFHIPSKLSAPVLGTVSTTSTMFHLHSHTWIETRPWALKSPVLTGAASMKLSLHQYLLHYQKKEEVPRGKVWIVGCVVNNDNIYLAHLGRTQWT